MNLNHLFYPEMRRFDSNEDRRSAWKRATLESGLSRYYLVAAAFLICFHGTVVIASDGLATPDRTIVRLVSLVASGAGALSVFWFFRRAIRRSLRRQLTENGTPLCIQCGYDLTRITSERCPECGGDR